MIDATTTTPTGAAVPYERLDFVLDAEHEAHQPPEVGEGRRRDDVRLLVSVGDAAPVHARFAALGEFLAAGDLVVVNTSATVPAAVDGRLPDGDPIVVHFSGELPGGEVLVEVRQPVGGHDRTAVRGRPGRRRPVGCRPGASPRTVRRVATSLAGVGRPRWRTRSSPPSSLPTGDRSGTATSRANGRSRRTRRCSPRTRQRRDAERGAAVHRRAGHRPRRSGDRGRAAPAAHRRVVARGRRAPVPRALPRPACHRRRDQRGRATMAGA